MSPSSPSPGGGGGSGWGDEDSRAATPPFRAQWESAALVADFLAGRDAATDPLWQASAAVDAAEYARWADHLCGCACLQMAFGALGRDIPPIHAIRREIQALGGYVELPDGSIRGLIYAGAVAWLAGQGIPARIALDLAVADIPALLDGGRLFVASVHPAIRRPEADPPARGGHLVLVFGADAAGALRLHNPSGHDEATRRDVRLAPEAFARFFAGRGIVIG
ncbi:hypothetical protein [Falsiroseomonas oryziterrae]|uniref:hypothetical protein n=1 Tax=Falsiroseomonas oryziterrae TaxID=2911368 RepID=UPI001F1C8F1F|nr:hypothetical protein [Roseomonas sp. NPKOSM-4]